MTKLLILTHSFPFGKGEAFIEHELPIICKNFDRVYICPTRDVSAHVKKVNRAIPLNCKVFSAKGYHTRTALFSHPVVYLNAWKIFKNSQRRESRWLTGVKWFYHAFKAAFFASVIVRQIQIALKETSFDGIIYSYWCAETAIATAALCEFGLTKLGVTRAHRYELYQEFSALNYWPYVEYLNRNLSAFFPISEHGKQGMLTAGYNANLIRAQYLGVPEGRIKNEPSSDGVLRIVSCSRVISLKRVSRILALAKCMSNSIMVEWSHFGDGPESKDICNNIELLKNSSLTVYWHGEVHNSVVLDHFCNRPVDFFINLSEIEGVPVSIMEAMAHGIPAIATNVGGVGELVQKSSGILLPVEFEIPEVSAKILHLLGCRHQFISLRENVFLQWSKYFSAEKNFGEFVENLHCLLSTKERSNFG